MKKRVLGAAVLAAALAAGALTACSGSAKETTAAETAAQTAAETTAADAGTETTEAGANAEDTTAAADLQKIIVAQALHPMRKSWMLPRKCWHPRAMSWKSWNTRIMYSPTTPWIQATWMQTISSISHTWIPSMHRTEPS